MVANVNFDKNFANFGEPGDPPAAAPPLLAAGDEIQYEFSVEHQGGDDIHTLLLDDTLLGFTDLNLLDEVTAGNLVLLGDDGDGILESGETWTFSEAIGSDLFTYVLTQEDLDSNGTAEADPSPFSNTAGQIDNAAFLTTFGAAGEELSQSLETASAEITLEPEIHIEKSTNGDDADSPTGPLIAVGGDVTWQYVVTNTGNVALSNVDVQDDQGETATFVGGDTDNDGLLDLTETWTYEATGTATAGQYANVGSATGDGPDGTTVSDDDPSHYFGVAASIDIEKSTNGDDADSPTGPLIAVGGDVTWQYVVTNTGNVALSNVDVQDDQGETATFVGGDTDNDGLLDLTETWTYEATGTATAGQYANVGSVTADDPLGTQVSDNDPSHYFGVDSSIDIEKSTNGDDADSPTGPLIAVGGDVTWQYVVTNTGNVALGGVSVTDDNGTPGDTGDDFNPAFIGGDTNNDGLLDLTETWLYEANGTAEAGQYGNIADVRADDVLGTEVTDEDPSHYFGVDSSIDIEKSTNGDDADSPTGPLIAVGGDVTWQYVVTNTGNVALGGVSVADDNGTPGDTGDDFNPAFIGGDTNNDGLLDLTETWLYEANGTAEAGQYGNIADVRADDVLGTEVTDEDPSHYFGVELGIDIEKSTNGDDADSPTGPLIAVGGDVTWQYVVTNTGNVALSNVDVQDDQGETATFVGGDTDNDGLLDLTETWTYEATGTATAGQYANVGSATGDGPDGTTVSDDDPSHYFGVAASIDIEKSTNGDDADSPTGPLIAVGGDVTWQYVVTNTGNVALSNVDVQDDQGETATFVGGDTDNDGLLDLTETWTYEATGTATAGQYANVGSVTADDPLGTQVSDNDPSHYFGVDSSIDIEKSTNGDDADSPTGPLIAVGDDVTWQYVVTNTGNVALGGVSVTDDNGTPGDTGDDFNPAFIGGDTNNDGLLDLTETWLYEANGTAEAGQYGNIADVRADDVLGTEVTDEDPSHYFGVDSSIDIEKSTNGDDADSPTGPLIAVGGDVTWQYVVTNTGNVALGGVSVTDDNGTPGDTGDDFNPAFIGGDTNNDGLLDLTETWLYEANGTAEAGQYGNIADVRADDVLGTEVTDEDPSHYFGVNSSIDIEKSTNGVDADTPTGPNIVVGDPVVWTYAVTNTGNVALGNVSVTDDNGTPGDTGDDFSPAFIGGDTNNDGLLDLTETWLYEANGTAEAGQYGNIANVTADDVLGEQVSDEDPSHYFGEEPNPGTGQTPGFWKNHEEIYNQELDSYFIGAPEAYDRDYETVFGVTLMSDGDGHRPKYDEDPTLGEALAAKGGGEGALLRASSSALANSFSDDLNFSFADTSLLGDDSPGVLATLALIDRDGNMVLSTEEVILAVQDVYGDVALDHFDFGDVGTVASALDSMNNLPHIDANDFLV